MKLKAFCGWNDRSPLFDPATDTRCADWANVELLLHGQPAGIICNHHVQEVARRLFRRGHKTCRTHELTDRALYVVCDLCRRRINNPGLVGDRCRQHPLDPRNPLRVTLCTGTLLRADWFAYGLKLPDLVLTLAACPGCDGDGRLVTVNSAAETCSKCDGSGRTLDTDWRTKSAQLRQQAIANHNLVADLLQSDPFLRARYSLTDCQATDPEKIGVLDALKIAERQRLHDRLVIEDDPPHQVWCEGCGQTWPDRFALLGPLWRECKTLAP